MVGSCGSCCNLLKLVNCFLPAVATPRFKQNNCFSIRSNIAHLNVLIVMTFFLPSPVHFGPFCEAAAYCGRFHWILHFDFFWLKLGC